MSDKLGLKAKMLLQAQTLVRTFAMNSLPGGREALARALGVGVDAPDRDIATECGYPAVVGIDQFRRLADRHGLAERVVNCPPDESWATLGRDVPVRGVHPDPEGAGQRLAPPGE
jgi:hypothetical protein